MCLNSWAGASIDIHVATHKRVCKMISPADMETQYCRYYNACLLSIEQMRKCKIELRASISFCWVTSKQTETEPSKMVWRQEITKKCDFTSTTRHFFREFNISNGPQAPVQLELWNWMSRWKKKPFPSLGWRTVFMMTMVGSPSEPRATAMKQGARTILSGPSLAASSHQHSIIFLLHDHFIAVQPRRSLRSGTFSEAIGSPEPWKLGVHFTSGP